jgi:ribosomal protein S12 methylthiotransferase accessory factor
MTVGIVGSGPAATAADAALADVDTVRTDSVGDHAISIVTGQAGDPAFAQANEQALETATPWLAVEIGGIGGQPFVQASISAFGPEAGCYDCLQGRVQANSDRQEKLTDEVPAHTERFAGAVAAREAARYLQGTDIFGQVITLPVETRPFLPLPNCGCADPVDRTLGRDHVDRELEASLARAEQALDELVGIVQEVGEAESFPVPYYLARGCETTGFSDASAARDAAGVAIDWNSAFMKALGEALERYCAGVYRTDSLETAPPTELPDAVDPSAFICEGHPDPTTPIEFVEGAHLASRERVSLPAEFVYHPPPASRYHSPVTTGLGLGNSTVEAILAGLYEVLERDAMMLSWYSTFEPLGLQLDDPTYETLTSRARSEDLSVSTLLLTQDVDVPVVAAAVQRDEWPKLAFGTGAALDVDRAANSALAEALQNWTELRGMGPDEAANALGAIGQYAAEPGPAAAFVDHDAVVPADSVGPDTVPTGEAELDAVLDRVEDSGLDAYGVRLTTRDVAGIGFEAVRAVVPSVQPLTFGSHTFGERAVSVPEQLGFEPALETEHHPFP